MHGPVFLHTLFDCGLLLVRRLRGKRVSARHLLNYLIDPLPLLKGTVPPSCTQTMHGASCNAFASPTGRPRADKGPKWHAAARRAE